jgi:hypothetical protein
MENSHFKMRFKLLKILAFQENKKPWVLIHGSVLIVFYSSTPGDLSPGGGPIHAAPCEA